MTAVQGEALAANEGTGWTVDDSEFGARLALVRQRMQWNIKEAARECDVPAASWGSWEAGSMPRRYTEICDKISRRTGADYVWLMAGSSTRSARPQAIAGAGAGAPGSSSPNRRYGPTALPVTARRRVASRVSPIGPGRRDSTRPVSAVPANKRRPQLVRPSNRPIAG